MSDLTTIITESRKINSLLRDIYTHSTDKGNFDCFDSCAQQLANRLDKIDKCHKENVLHMNSDLDDYLVQYIKYLSHYLALAQEYRSAYITWRLGKDSTLPDQYEDIYSEMFNEYRKSNPGDVYSEQEIIKRIKINVTYQGENHKSISNVSAPSDIRVKYSIFVSSTYEDLKEERMALIPVLLENDFIPVGMELFHAAPTSQWNVITNMLNECDYYLLIIGGRYGSIDENSGIGYTEKEYLYAKEHNIPIIAFLPAHPEKITRDKMDKDDLEAKQEKLKQFIKRVELEDKTVTRYDNIDSLKYEVATSLKNLLKYTPRSGWIKADTFKENPEQLFGKNNDKFWEKYPGIKTMFSEFENRLKEIEKNQESIDFGDESAE